MWTTFIKNERVHVTSRKTDFKYIWPWPLTPIDSNVISVILNLKEEFASRDATQILNIFGIDLWPIAVIWSLHCNLRSLCTKYENHRSINERWVLGSTRQIFRIVTLTLSSNSLETFIVIYTPLDNHYTKYEHTPSKLCKNRWSYKPENWFTVYLTYKFDSKVLLLIWNPPFYLHTKSNHFA